MTRGYELCEEEETGRTFWWKRCEIPDCPNLVCLGRSERFCWPHSGSGMNLETMIELSKELPVDILEDEDA